MITVRHIILAARHRHLHGHAMCWVDAVNQVGRGVGTNHLAVRQARRLCARLAQPGDSALTVLDRALTEVAPRHHCSVIQDEPEFEL
ncbi:hypothetical protein [Stomatohabitans albus]|uniref:hypothetical protein n=1 Tax=Stomatohabitans albus TaxID=3110766 RepID=UPI00300C7D1C